MNEHIVSGAAELLHDDSRPCMKGEDILWKKDADAAEVLFM